MSDDLVAGIAQAIESTGGEWCNFPAASRDERLPEQHILLGINNV
jgi:hypothetical protein